MKPDQSRALEEAFSGGEIVSRDEGRSKFCPYFVFRNWFQEAYFATDQKHEDRIRLFLNLDLNFTESQRKSFAKARAMGLLPFHFHHPVAQLMESLNLPFNGYHSPEFDTHFYFHGPVNECIRMVKDLGNHHVDITAKALESIELLEETYNLDQPSTDESHPRS